MTEFSVSVQANSLHISKPLPLTKMSYLTPKSDKYVRGVSFDNMTDKDLPDYSFTLRGKSNGFQRTRRSRTFMVATDLANYSEYALTWANEVCLPVLGAFLFPFNLISTISSRKLWIVEMN